MLPIDTGIKAPQVQDSFLDVNSLNSVKAMGREKDPQALKEVAKKFESMFVQQMLKSMREANAVFAQDGYLNSNESNFHRDMLDQQMVLNLTSGQGMGLADQFYRQMSQAYGMDKEAEKPSAGVDELPEAVNHSSPSLLTEKMPSTQLPDNNWRHVLSSASFNASVDESFNKSDDVINSALDLQTLALQPLFLRSNPLLSMSAAEKTTASAVNNTASAVNNTASAVNNRVGLKAEITQTPENFVALLKPHAEKAAAELNINPDVLIAQVALETGWGKHVIHNKQGENSFNLFNIKANSSWQGDKVNISTLEYQGAVAAIEKADFRKYNDYAESFSDYVRLMKNNPRYQEVLAAGKNSAEYAEALQSAGYAIDPEYAKKIKTILKSELMSDLSDIAKDVSTKSATAVLSMAASARKTIME